MSRLIEQVASVQFQVDARQASAAMQALQNAAKDLGKNMDDVNKNIADLGKDVPKDNPQLLEYQKQLRGLESQLRDVQRAQRDFLRGAKAADQLLKAAGEQNIEGLSFRSIKAGINGLRKRQEGLSPGDAQDMKDWRIIKDVIDEADRVVKQAGADVQNVVQTIRDGGKVSEQAMRQTLNTLKELKGSVDETDAEYRTYGNDLDFMEAKLKEFNEAQRRAKGEIVDANDARREMNKLTEEGAAAAKREAEEAEQLVASLKQESEELVRKRGEIKQNIEDTQQQIDENHKLIEEKHRQLAADEETFNAEQQGRRTTIDGLKTQAEAERKLANEKSDAAETHRRAAELQRQTTEQLTEKVTELQGKLAALNAEPVKPKVDSSALEALKTELNEIESQLTSMGDRHTAEMTAFNQRLWKKQDRMKEIGAQQYLPHTTDPNADYYNFGNKAKKIIKSFAAGGDDRRYDLMQSLAERGGYLEKLKELESEKRAIVKQRTEYVRAMDETGKKDWEEAIRQLDELEGLYSTVINILKDYKQEFDKIKPVDDAHYEKYEALIEKRATILEKIASVEQQGVQSTDKLAEAQRLYNEKVQERIQKEKELEAIQNRSWTDDPEVKRLDAEIAKLEELIAVSEKYKKQFAKMSDAKFEDGYMGGDKEVQAALHIGSDPRKSIWGAADYLKGAYHDRSRASLLDYVKEHADQAGGEERVAEYQQAADRVAKGIVQNAQENFRRAIYREIQDGNWTSEAMEEQLDTFRSQFQNEFRNARPGQLQDDPEYHYYKYIIEQMEKYIEVAKKVEAERAKIAGGEEYVELAKHKDDIDQPHKGLLWQKEERDWDRATIKTEDIDRRRKDEEYTKSQEVEQAKRNETEAERQLNEEKAKSNQQTEEELRLKGELETAQSKLAESKQRENDEQQQSVKLQAEAIEQGNKAAAAETKLTDAQSDATQKQVEFNQKQQEGLDNINQMAQGNQALQESIDGLNGELEQNSKDITDNAAKTAEAEQQKQQARQLSIQRMEEMLAKLKEEYYTEELTAEEREKHIRDIQKLEKAISTEKAKPMLDMMTQRMQDVGSLSKSALEETRKFWEAMAQGADKGSEKLATAEAHIKALVEEEQKRNEAQAGKVIGDMGSYSDKEIAEAVKSFEQLRDAQTHGNDEWRKFNELAEQGKQHLEELAKADALAKMEERMSNLTNLSDAALAETKKYWEALKAGAEKESEDLAKAETNLTRIIDLEKERTRIENERKARGLSGELNIMSEAEISEAIKAAKELHAHMASADPEARKLAESIAKAEAHIKQYGIESARAAQRQEEMDATMQKQFQTMMDGMRRGVMPSKDAIKSQMNYWQKLIDDPKTAAESLQFYRDQLAEVKKMYDFMIKSQGEAALTWFSAGKDRNASGNQIKEMADRLKEYRGTLLKETNAAEIQQIDAILQRIGASAKKATEELMDFEKAKELALQAGDDVYGKNNPAFLASPEEIQAATKSIEKYREELFKTIKQKKDMGEATDDEEAELQELAKYLKDLKFEQDNFNMSREKMEALMNTPVNATSIDELRAAIKRADAELKRMEGSLGQNNAQYKTFAEQVRNAKNMLKEMEGQAKASATAWEKAWSRLKTYVVMYMGFNAVWQKMVGTADDLMQLSDKMGEVRKTTGFTADEVGRLSDSLKKLDTRTTITGLLDLSVAAGQLGLKTQEDVEGFTIAANKLMVALPEMGKEGATEMLKVALATGEIDKIRKQMEQGLIDGSSATAVAMEKVGSTIDRLRATSAATAPAITDFVKRVGAVGAQSGISIDQVAALGSTVDALGMRVEMSATALSRMIPAIKNNAFDVAKAIGVTPNTLRELFEAGRGMEAILLIFQKIKDSGMGADDIDKMLGMGNMKEVMKELNQQGARAGIVFAGLSQNVDVLREHLGTAAQAYEENIAVQQEYDKMNETMAAKWERLKNQLEETFIGDKTQRWLGWVIDQLRVLVNIISGNVTGALTALHSLVWSLVAAFGVWKTGILELAISGFGLLIKGLVGVKNAIVALSTAKGWKLLGENLWLLMSETRQYIALQWQLVRAHGEAEKAAIRQKLAENTLGKVMNANVWLAIAAAVAAAAYAIYNWVTAVNEAAKEAAKFQAELDKETKKVDNLTDSIGKARAKAEDANKEVEKSKKALDEVKKSTDGTKESTDKLTKAESDLIEKEEIRNRAMAEHKRLIEQFNSEYGKYLGFMLSEVSSNIELANARQLVNDKLRETITLKRKEAALTRVENEMGKDRDDAYASLWSAVRYSATSTNRGKTVQDPTKAAKVMTALTKAAQDANHDRKSFEDAAKKIFQENKIAYRGNSVLGDALSYFEEVAKIHKKNRDVEQQFVAEETANREQSQKDLKLQYAAAADNYTDLIKKYTNATGKAKQKAAADLLRQQDTINEMVNNASNYFDVSDAGEKASYDSFIKNSEARVKSMAANREKLLKEAGSAYTSRKNVGGGTTTSIKENPWGGNAPAESTDYATWDVNELVARRNQMDKFKNILKPDTDIRAVLAEDKALMKALDNGLKEDWKSVLGWYNTERKKIQEELKSERFSTNEGHWRDEKQGRSRKNRFRESDYALAELDRYYSKRKEELEKARIEENMSEELFNRQAELLEQEHLERRSKLRETFTAGNTKAEKEMVKQFRDWWSKLEKEGKLDEVPWATVESEWAKALASEIGRNNLKAQQDLTQMQQITVKHLNKIADIIAKERPYDGIVDNLRKNLTDMDILFADMEKKGTTDPATLVKEQNTRLQFLLGEAETAYQSSIDDVLKRMADAGMTAWAEEISKSDAMKNALMAQLQTAYDEIQNAIKKEASQIKKQTDIWWNDLMPGQDTSRKGGFEKILSRLGLQEDQVKRANALIGAGAASDRVADKLAIKQMQIRLQMQQVYYQKMRQMWDDRISSLREQGKEIDAQHAEISKQLSLSEEQKKLDEQRVAIQNQLEESQNRLYTELKEWGDLLANSIRDIMESYHAGEEEYYNSLAMYNLTGKGGPGAGTYVVTENAGKKGATAHYEYLSELQAIERQREIERENAQAEAWKKVWEDINMKLSETITDRLNAMLQNANIDLNTKAVDANTAALNSLNSTLAEGLGVTVSAPGIANEAVKEKKSGTRRHNKNEPDTWGRAEQKRAGYQVDEGGMPDTMAASPMDAAKAQIDASTAAKEAVLTNQAEIVKGQKNADKQAVKSSKASFAAMTAAANMYGIAYQTMTNDNLSTTQKVEMMIVQAAGQAAISMLTASMAAATGDTAANAPRWISKTLAELGPIGGPVAVGVFTALIGGLMGMAASKITKSKSQIAQATGASSASAGKLTTGMITYAEGNVNEMTDPATLTPGRHYNVDGADGHTYRAKYTGVNAKTHITSGPEFHLVGEKGREAIIDAHTTRNIQLNEPEIWRSIQTLYNGGSLSHRYRRSGRGVRAYADGNLDDFETTDAAAATAPGGFTAEQAAAFQSSLDRNNELLERALTEGIKGVFGVYGPDGLVHTYDTAKKTLGRYGENY